MSYYNNQQPPVGVPPQWYPPQVCSASQVYPPSYAQPPPPQYAQPPPQSNPQPGCLEGCLAALCCCCVLDACF